MYREFWFTKNLTWKHKLMLSFLCLILHLFIQLVWTERIFKYLKSISLNAKIHPVFHLTINSFH